MPRRVIQTIVVLAFFVSSTPLAAESLWDRLFGRKDTVAAQVIGGARLPVAVPSYLDLVIRQAADETALA